MSSSNSGDDEAKRQAACDEIRESIARVVYEANRAAGGAPEDSVLATVAERLNRIAGEANIGVGNIIAASEAARKLEPAGAAQQEKKVVETRDASTETPCWWPYFDSRTDSTGDASTWQAVQATVGGPAAAGAETQAVGKLTRKANNGERLTMAEVTSRDAGTRAMRQGSGDEPSMQVARKTGEKGATAPRRAEPSNGTLKPPIGDARAPKKIHRKPAAVLVKVGGGLSYAETLRKVKETDVDFDSLGTKVTSMRQTTSGNLIVELTKSSKALTAADLLRGKIAAAIPGSKVSCLRQTATVEIVDLDELATKEEVHAAIAKSINADGSAVAVTGIWRTRAGQQMATATVPIAAAGRLTHISIGWLRCRVRPRREQPQRCYRCHGFGHGSRRCAGPDLSGSCRRCGQQGHLEKSCPAGDDNCVACDRLGCSRAAHRPGSGACAARRAALNTGAENQNAEPPRSRSAAANFPQK